MTVWKGESIIQRRALNTTPRRLCGWIEARAVKLQASSSTSSASFFFNASAHLCFIVGSIARIILVSNCFLELSTSMIQTYALIAHWHCIPGHCIGFSIQSMSLILSQGQGVMRSCSPIRFQPASTFEDLNTEFVKLVSTNSIA